MDIWELLRITIRRWYVFVPLAVLAAVGSAVVARTVAVEYTNDASMLLVNPEPAAILEDEVPSDAVEPYPYASESSSEDEPSGNRWLSFSGSLNTAAQALQLSATSQEMRDELEAEGLSPIYSVTPDRKNPILVLQTSSADPAVSQATLDRLIELISDDLDARQAAAGAPESTKIRAEVLARDRSPERATGARVRVQLLALALGLALAAATSVAVDQLLRRRQARVAEHADADLVADAADAADGAADEQGRVASRIGPRREVSADEISERLVALFKPPEQGFTSWAPTAAGDDEPAEAR